MRSGGRKSAAWRQSKQRAREGEDPEHPFGSAMEEAKQETIERMQGAVVGQFGDGRRPAHDRDGVQTLGHGRRARERVGPATGYADNRKLPDVQRTGEFREERRPAGDAAPRDPRRIADARPVRRDHAKPLRAGRRVEQRSLAPLPGQPWKKNSGLPAGVAVFLDGERGRGESDGAHAAECSASPCGDP
jgi:hypothetical protein